jgi:cytochrome c-type biogenesis protein CcmE
MNMEQKIETGTQTEELQKSHDSARPEETSAAVATGKTEEGGKVAKSKKRMSRRTKGVVIVVLVIAVALVIGLWGTAPANYLTVNDVISNSDSYKGKTIEVKGIVEDWNSTANTFSLADGDKKINVTYITVPEGFNNGKDVVVKGTLMDLPVITIESQTISVGCPSKY